VSQQNLEIVRRLYDSDAAMRRAAFPAVFAEFFHRDAEIVPPEAYPDTEASYRGVEGFLRWQAELDEIWDDWRVEAERFFGVGDHVVVFARISGSAKQSRASLATSTGHLLTLNEGRVARVEIFLDRREALKAIGLGD
jgi:ketosteroid isomerase-like protein